MITIRPASSADTPILVSLLEILGYEVTEERVNHRLTNILASSQDKILVAVEDNQVVGFIHIFLKQLLEKPLAGESGALAVAQNMQGKGVGKLLIKAGEDWARDQGCKRLVVKSNIMRAGAHAFYQAVGYSTSKRQVVFEKTL